MNKAAIEKFAVRARRRLREQVEQKAFEIGITAQKAQPATVRSSDSLVFNERKILNAPEKRQYERLKREVEVHGFDYVMDEAAYTWFNRFIALRFMEVNGYLETGVRVFSSADPDKKEPDLLTYALKIDLPVERDRIIELQDRNATEELYKYLVIAQCNALHQAMPFLFEKIADYTELLFPGNLLAMDSVVWEMTEWIAEEDWREVEIIGWLYQYYISEKKDEVFAALKKNQKITKENIPAATQLFTPHWIVRYMVENTVGRIWLEAHPNEELKVKWKYYLEPAEQESEVKAELKKFVNSSLRPEEIKILDPACGSGHILVYAFDLFYDIYQSAGYIDTEIPRLILEKNLFGLEIDDRAAQLAYLAVVMKARERNRTILKESLDLNICAIQETNELSEEAKEMLLNGTMDRVYAREQVDQLVRCFFDAKEYGSILRTDGVDAVFWQERLTWIREQTRDLYNSETIDELQESCPTLIKQVEILGQKYHAVVANPPYMGSKGMNPKLNAYLEREFPDSKSDLFAVFIERGLNNTIDGYYNAMVTMQSWMFLSSFEALRIRLIHEKTINTLVHMDNMVMGIAFGTSATVWRNLQNSKYRASYFYITLDNLNEKNEPKTFPGVNPKNNIISAEDFHSIPGSPIAYWASYNVRKVFSDCMPLKELAEPRTGIQTGNNQRFLRIWHEVDYSIINFSAKTHKDIVSMDYKWYPYNKGGGYRKWYGNNEIVINMENDGKEIREQDKKFNYRLRDPNYYFLESLTWSFLSSSYFSVRYSPGGYLCDVAGSSIYPSKELGFYLLGLLSSKVIPFILEFINPTLNYQVENIANLPIFLHDNIHIINQMVKENIEISKEDWDSLETSWDFKRSPLIASTTDNSTVEHAYKNWLIITEERFKTLKQNEEELNRIFIDIYRFQNELVHNIDDKEITISKAELGRDIRLFLSYAIGCMLGRYSLDEPGLIFAGGEFDANRYHQFPIDRDGVLPILGDEYFEDDIVTRLIQFVKVTFSDGTMAENLDFIAAVLGRTENESALERIRKYFLNDFYKDHLQAYKNRPIYWLFTSGKEKAFSCLIYMHRYDKTTISRIRTDYLHVLQGKMEIRARQLEETINSEVSAREKREAGKQLATIGKQREELRKYDELLRHYAEQQIEIDLDDGVRINYAKFKVLLAPVKGIDDEE